MKFETFTRKLVHIKEIKDRVSKLNDEFSKIFNSYVTIESLEIFIDKMINELVLDILESIDEYPELIQEDIDYLIWESDFGRRNLQGTIRDKEVDMTIWNQYLILINDKYTNDYDSFENPKFVIGY